MSTNSQALLRSMRPMLPLACLALVSVACKREEAAAPEPAPTPVETPAPAVPLPQAPSPVALPVPVSPVAPAAEVSPVQAPAAASPTDAKASEPVLRIQRICQDFSDGRLDDALAGFADDFTEEWPGSPEQPPIHGKAELKQAWQDLKIAFPDAKVAVARLMLDGDTVVAQMVFTGTHKGPFLGHAASGKAVGFPLLRILKIADGKVKSARTYGNAVAVLAQIGAIKGMPVAPVPKLPTEVDVVSAPGSAANADVMKGVYSSFGTADLAGYADRMTPDTVYHDLAQGRTWTGIEANKAALMAWKAAFPEVKLDKVEFTAIGPYVIGEPTLRAVHKGALGSIKPTGKVVTMHGADVVRLVDGKVAEGWGYADEAEVLRQLGVMPAPRTPAVLAPKNPAPAPASPKGE